MVKIIINADDFGKSVGRNRAIDDSFRHGLIHSAGLIVTGKYLQDAVDLMNRGGYVENVHLHLNLSANLLHEGSDDTPLTEAMRQDPFFCMDGKFKNYHGLPHRFTDIRKWRVVYHELVAQYEKFKEVTGGKADYKHIDFHLWYNLTWPVSLALRFFTRKYKIESVRYWGIHQMRRRQYILYKQLSGDPHVKCVPSTNIDYFLSKREFLVQFGLVELYCHPNYKDGVFLDDSPSYLKHERQPLLTHIEALRRFEDVEFMSWKDYSTNH